MCGQPSSPCPIRQHDSDNRGIRMRRQGEEKPAQRKSECGDYCDDLLGARRQSLLEFIALIARDQDRSISWQETPYFFLGLLAPCVLALLLAGTGEHSWISHRQQCCSSDGAVQFILVS